MSRSAEAATTPELSECPQCARRYHPPHPEGCRPCRRLTETRPRRVETTTFIDHEIAAEADAATYYFLESFWGHPEEP